MKTKIAYVLKSFPELSETFIADEALSLYSQNLECCILQMYPGSTEVVHPSAQKVLDRSARYRLGAVGRWGMLSALGSLMARQPMRTIRTFFVALSDPNRWSYFQMLPAAVWCLKERVSLLHAHFADVNLIHSAAIADWIGKPFGVTTHRYDILDDPIDFKTAKSLLERAHFCVTISEFNRRHMQVKYGLPEHKIQVVHCGIDLERFAYQARPAGLAGGTLRLLNVGRLAPIKAQDILLAALAIVKQRGVAFSMEIIGDGPLREDLLEQTDALGLKAEVTFHGAQTEIFVRQKLATADVFVLSSRSEGLPVVCIEALALGTPVIATRIFGIPELIQHEISGWLVPPEDPLALADAICHLAQRPGLLAGMCAAGRSTVEAEFDRVGCTRQLAVLWEAAIARGIRL